MGCTNEKMMRVAPEGELSQKRKNTHAKGSESLNGSSASLGSGGERPSKSATSKASKHSHDSGYSGNDLEDDGIDEYANIITENSDGAIVEKIESNFQAPELDLCLSGTPAPRNLSAKDKARLDEQRILENLRNEGLIATSKSEAKNGLAFEVVEATSMLRRAVPARLAKLEKKKKKKKTKEEIAEKLAKAEQRRKEAENEKLEKINAVSAKSDVQQVQQDMAKQNQELLECTTKKVDSVVEKKEQRLQEIKDKLKAREEHAAKVRLRKKLHIPTQEELEEFEMKNNENKQHVVEIESQQQLAAEVTVESQQAPASDADTSCQQIPASENNTTEFS